MQERAATVDGQRHSLGPHFAVFATQNPVEQEGTYPLPEAELDRFIFKIAMAYPNEEEERGILRLHHDDSHAPDELPRVLDAAALEKARALVRAVIVQEEIVSYAAALVRATRADLSFALGASPRAGVLLVRAAKANATLEGRDFVIPEACRRCCRCCAIVCSSIRPPSRASPPTRRCSARCRRDRPR
jgi:MoxR-like ATPase